MCIISNFEIFLLQSVFTFALQTTQVCFLEFNDFKGRDIQIIAVYPLRMASNQKIPTA